MFKILLLIWRRADLTRAAFRDYYEQNHAPLGVRNLPGMGDYRRSYPVWPEPAPAALGGFDVMTAVWHAGRADFDRQVAMRQSAPIKEVTDADESKFMSRRRLVLCVDERGMSPDDMAEKKRRRAHPIVSKYLRFVSYRTSMTAEDYEREIAQPSDAAMEGLVGYRRNHILFDDPYSLSVTEAGPASLRDHRLPFDVIEEFWMGGAIGPRPPKDLGAWVVRAEEFRSPGGLLHAPVAD